MIEATLPTFVALKSGLHSNFFFNGQAIANSGIYSADGASVIYQRNHDHSETIFIKGPTLRPLHIMVRKTHDAPIHTAYAVYFFMRRSSSKKTRSTYHIAISSIVDRIRSPFVTTTFGRTPNGRRAREVAAAVARLASSSARKRQPVFPSLRACAAAARRRLRLATAMYSRANLVGSRASGRRAVRRAASANDDAS